MPPDGFEFDSETNDQSEMDDHREIAEELDRIYRLMSQIEATDFMSRKHSETREWVVLGTIRNLLISAGFDAPTYATKSETPDFYTLTASRDTWAPVEILEVLHPEYRRQDFYRRAAQPDAPMFYNPLPILSHPWAPLRNEIAKKARKNYPNETRLFVYFDINGFSFPDWKTPFHAQLLTEHAANPFEEASAFDQVLIMSANRKSLVRLHPEPMAIATD